MLKQKSKCLRTYIQDLTPNPSYRLPYTEPRKSMRCEEKSVAVTQIVTPGTPTGTMRHSNAYIMGRLRAVILGVLMDEVVERLEGLPHLRLADLESVPCLFVIPDPDLAVGLHPPVWRPVSGRFPALPGLLEGGACGRDVLEDAQRIQRIQDVEEDTTTPRCQSWFFAASG